MQSESMCVLGCVRATCEWGRVWVCMLPRRHTRACVGPALCARKARLKPLADWEARIGGACGGPAVRGTRAGNDDLTKGIEYRIGMTESVLRRVVVHSDLAEKR